MQVTIYAALRLITQLSQCDLFSQENRSCMLCSSYAFPIMCTLAHELRNTMHGYKFILFVKTTHIFLSYTLFSSLKGVFCYYFLDRLIWFMFENSVGKKRQNNCERNHFALLWSCYFSVYSVSGSMTLHGGDGSMGHSTTESLVKA